ncbi:hypothetical protein OKW11_006342 [Pseudomonas baetica]|nr:hypothetical protein [Pseudomonas baetica]
MSALDGRATDWVMECNRVRVNDQDNQNEKYRIPKYALKIPRWA